MSNKEIANKQMRGSQFSVRNLYVTFMFALINERSLSRDSGSQFTIESSATCPGRTAETRPCKLSRRDLRSFSLIASTLIVWPSKDNDRACKSISKSLTSIPSSGISKPRYLERKRVGEEKSG